MVEEAPPAKALRAACANWPAAPATADEASCARYLRGLMEALPAPRGLAPYKERRDKGTPLSAVQKASRQAKSGAPVGEAAFARQREASIAALLRASPAQRAALRAKSQFGAAAAAAAAVPGVASKTVCDKVRKRALQEADAETPAHAAIMRKKVEGRKWSAFVKGQTGDAGGRASPPAGVCLLAGSVPGGAAASGRVAAASADGIADILKSKASRSRATRSTSCASASRCAAGPRAKCIWCWRKPKCRLTPMRRPVWRRSSWGPISRNPLLSSGRGGPAGGSTAPASGAERAPCSRRR